ncbi:MULTISPECIES: cation transporter [Aequorivita]|uniref:Cation transporter n=1 Tax=Aequorivita antarctica TaxID=153266 RepID=A0A5C6YVF8_9FLAO|nr:MULTISPECIES: cation transporter [Aequorivita]TXD71554.1 cation transporter [Aequorivita antarctica]SRX54829.1 Cadmium, cobalt and zinc/H(+)-K(+) antiporter [Aequorivita sp. CIP111184]SRX75304.1 Cadmium, cobalt and zinc/H(+)-K(+) antiporter [Aequorivita antarctica]
MDKSIFKIQKMDCPSEESIIRMKLERFHQIKQLDFDITNRTLVVYHNGNLQKIEGAIRDLKFNEQLITTITTDEVIFDEPSNQRKLLWAVLAINFLFFIIEITTGWLSKSMGLVADSLDMLADSFVYGLSLIAVGGSLSRKKNIATMAGGFQILLAIIGFMEIVRRFFSKTETPDFLTMIIVSILALLANAACLYLLQKSKSNEAHMQASMIFTSNDIIINFGVIIAGFLVLWTNSRIPDLIVGAIVFIIVTKGAINILKLGK